jgi:hypothetical protein
LFVTFPRPTIVAVMPETVPVKAGEANGASSDAWPVSDPEKVGAVAVPVNVGDAKGAKPEINAPVGMVTVPVKVGEANGAKFAMVAKAPVPKAVPLLLVQVIAPVELRVQSPLIVTAA